VHYRGLPQQGSEARRRIDSFGAGVLMAMMIALSLLCWGPIPIACLWVGSEIDYLTGSVFFGIIVAFVALFPMLFGTLSLLRRVDSAWMLVRRAAGHDQRAGAMARVFGTTAFICAVVFAFWFLVIHGPGSQVVPGRAKS
jgi:hypothetical protein